MRKRFVYLNLLLLSFNIPVFGWGFDAHKHINRCAVFTLPYEMFRFYKRYLGYITESAVNPDKRRYAVKDEAARHYIDLDYYPKSDIEKLSAYWQQVIQYYSIDTLEEHGIVPWHIYRMKHALTTAFYNRDVEQILRISADIGHYIADANVPLHTSKNYNGQLTGQEGIHGLWETRLPELFKHHYNLLTGKAYYIKDTQKEAWKAVVRAHALADNALLLEKELSISFNPTQKFSFEKKGTVMRKVYSRAYAKAYHRLLEGQVEQQMRASIQMVGNFWFTCWVDAGKPNLGDLLHADLKDFRLEEEFATTEKLQVRDCG